MLIPHYYAQNYAGIMWTTLFERGVNFNNASIIDKGSFHITKFLGAPSSRLTRTITLALFQDNTAFFLTKIINHLFTPNFTLFNVNHALSSKNGGFMLWFLSRFIAVINATYLEAKESRTKSQNDQLPVGLIAQQ